MNLKWLDSQHKMLYFWLAIRYRVNPNHVWNLAHGKCGIENHKDKMIVKYFHKHQCFKHAKHRSQRTHYES